MHWEILIIGFVVLTVILTALLWKFKIRPAQQHEALGVPNSRRRVIVFGGAKGMGLCIADFLARSGNKITIADIDKKTPTIAAKKNYKGVILPESADYLRPLLDKDGYCDCDVAVIAVPINITPDIIRQVSPRLKADSLLMDVTSVKGPAMEAMDAAADVAASAGRRIRVLGTHPMFGPDVPFFGQTCVIVPSQNHPPGPWLEWWEQLLEAEGAVHIQSTAEEHDKMMLEVQVLLHYVLICFGTVLPRVGVDINKAYSFRTPMYEITMGLVSRIFAQSPDTYYWIQQHPQGEMVRKLFIQCSNEISDAFKKITLPEYDKLRLGIIEAIGQTNVAAYSSVAAVIIKDRANQKMALLSIEGKTACIENVETKKTHYGLVKEVSPTLVTIKTIKEHDKIVRISLKKARLLAPDEMNAWKTSHLPLKRYKLSFRTAQETNTQVIVSLASNRFGVANVTAISEDLETVISKKTIMLAIKVIDDEEGEAAYSAIKLLLRGIGCTLL